MRRIALGLIVILVITPCFAQTLESVSIATPETKAVNFLQEFDITFWQTMPFGLMWGYFIDQQLSNAFSWPETPHWIPILSFSTVLSLLNAYRHAQVVTKNEGTGNYYQGHIR